MSTLHLDALRSPIGTIPAIKFRTNKQTNKLFTSDGCHPEALRGGIYSITGSAEPVSAESFEGGERDAVDGELTDGMACSDDITPQSYYDADFPSAPSSSSSSWAADTAAQDDFMSLILAGEETAGGSFGGNSSAHFSLDGQMIDDDAEDDGIQTRNDEQTIRMVRESASSGDKRKDRGPRKSHSLSSNERKRAKAKEQKRVATEAADTNKGVYD